MSDTFTNASAVFGISDDAIRVMPEPLRAMTAGILCRLNLPEQDAAHIAECLVQVDLRGVVTHGTRRLRGYLNQYRAGELNPRPAIRVIRDEPITALLNGNGGIGYLVAARATEMVIAKADAGGLAVVATRYHGHVGSLGIYARMALERSMVTFSVAGGRDWMSAIDPGATVWDAMKSPPMCFGIPAAGDTPFVLDMSVNFFRDRNTLDEAMQRFPEAVVKSLGFKFVSTLLGGILAGSVEDADMTGEYAAATRGFLMIAFKPHLFGDAARFRSEVARILTESRSLPPMTGQNSTETPGSLEWQRERAWTEEGIPIGPAHRRQLETLATELDVPIPW